MTRIRRWLKAICKKSLLVERHAWRGFDYGSDLFDTALVLGFITFYVSNESVADSVREMKTHIEKAKQIMEGGRAAE